MLQYEEMLCQISGNGRFQALLAFMALSPYLFGAWMNTGSVFLAGLPESYCLIDGFNITERLNDSAKEMFIPWNYNTKDFDRCKQYDMTACDNNKTWSCFEETAQNQQVIPCSNGYYYDRETAYQETVVTEWNLVCGRLSLSSGSTSFYYLGMFLGSIIGGVLSDRFGRVFIYRTGAVLVVLCGLAISFSPNIYVFASLRMLVATVYMPIVVSGFVYANEISKPSWRATFGSLGNAIFGIGCMILAGFAFQWRKWRDLSITIAVGSIPLFVFSLFMPKSPRWLFHKKRKEEAQEACKVMAKRNNAKLSDQVFEDMCFSHPAETKKSAESKHFVITELFIRPCSRYMIISNGFVWAVTSLVYYGLALNSGKLAGNVYLNHALGGLMELIACLISIPLIWKFGRKNTTVVSLGASALSCLLSTCVIHFGNGNQILEIIGVALAMTGRFSSSVAFAVIYQHTVELFPTPGRGTALGFSSMSARIGSIITPFTLQLQYDVPWMTPTIFGVTALFAAFSAATFPETKDMPLLGTFEEAEEFFEKHLRDSFAAKLCCLDLPKKQKEFDENVKEFKSEEKQQLHTAESV